MSESLESSGASDDEDFADSFTERNSGNYQQAADRNVHRNTLSLN